MPGPDLLGGGVLVRKRAIVVGSGAGGATVAKELQGAFDVTVLELDTAELDDPRRQCDAYL